jgi:hypothetical protein
LAVLRRGEDEPSDPLSGQPRGGIAPAVGVSLQSVTASLQIG